MFLLYAMVIGLVVGLILGGRLERLGALQLRWPVLALAGLLVQVVLFLPNVGDRLGTAAPGVYVASTLAVFGFVLRNISLPGFAVIALGAASNLVAIVVNGGYMPASPAALRVLGDASRAGYSNSLEMANPALAPLTDIFALPPWLPFSNVFSVGDVLIALGVALTMVRVMRAPAPVTSAMPSPVPGGNTVE